MRCGDESGAKERNVRWTYLIVTVRIMVFSEGGEGGDGDDEFAGNGGEVEIFGLFFTKTKKTLTQQPVQYLLHQVRGPLQPQQLRRLDGIVAHLFPLTRASEPGCLSHCTMAIRTRAAR